MALFIVFSEIKSIYDFGPISVDFSGCSGCLSLLFYRLVIGRVRSRDYLLNGKRQTAVSTSAPNSLNVSAWK